MKRNSIRSIIVGVIFLCCTQLYAQRFSVDGGVLVKAEITIGNQNQWLKLGLLGFGTLNYGDISAESGISITSYQFLKRHTVKTSGLAYAYDFFALAGIGKNSNLLGSSAYGGNNTILYNYNGESGFQGLGFGFGKDFLPRTLKPYGIKRGAIMMRFSNANHSIHVSFKNDLKIGWFNGSGTDYGVTGSLAIGYTQINNPTTVYQTGIGIDLFTARPDYSRSPRNKINSDDGRKNVWFTLPPYKSLFYGNLYAYGSYQKEHFSVHTKLGVNSQKAGAYIQNLLHDGLGLNPRFPWQVDTKDKIYLEISGSLYHNTIAHE